LLYSSNNSDTAGRLQDSISSLPFVVRIVLYQSLAELADRFSSPEPLPEIIVLSAATVQEVSAFFDFRLRLKNQFVILVLPDADSMMVECSHQLYPRFITYEDSDFSDVLAVLKRIFKWEQIRLEWMEISSNRGELDSP
jgi:hypothetical protein